jgi:uncharacterized membrane protein YgdD (TMEM256/DUF423 family)
MARLLMFAGAVLAGVGVAAGSFGAHGLKGVLEATGRADNWETAVRYCMYHALAVLVVALAAAPGRMDAGRTPLLTAGWCFVAGTLVFSGCLAVLAVSGLRFLGAIVPIGGVLFLIGWALVAVAALRFPA